MLWQHLNSIGSVSCQHALLFPSVGVGVFAVQNSTEYIPSKYDELTQCRYNVMPMSQTIVRHEIMLPVCWKGRHIVIVMYTHHVFNHSLC